MVDGLNVSPTWVDDSNFCSVRRNALSILSYLMLGLVLVVSGGVRAFEVHFSMTWSRTISFKVVSNRDVFARVSNELQKNQRTLWHSGLLA